MAEHDVGLNGTRDYGSAARSEEVGRKPALFDGEVIHDTREQRIVSGKDSIESESVQPESVSPVL